MTNVTKSIDVNQPVGRVYNQWTQFETFPQFMDGVTDVRQLDDTHLRWVAEVGGTTKQWDAEITRQEPDRMIAWRAIDGAPNAGTVTFEPLEAERTRVTLEIDAEPEGMKEQAGAAMGILDRQVSGDLDRFRDFIEARGAETGGWRGEVNAGSRR